MAWLMRIEARRRVAGANLSVLLVVTTFLGCAWLSWRRLGSLIIDGGHELEVPRRLVEGGVLYRDIAWYWGPLAPWLNAGLYRLFGVTSDTLMWAGLVTAALACLGLYLLARRFLDPLGSSWVAACFLVVSAFSQRMDAAIFNFVAPYNFSATYGITLAIWSLVLLLHHAESGRTRTLTASAVLGGLVALTKLEATFAVAVAHGALFLTVLPRPSWPRILGWASGLAIPVAGYLVAAHLSQGLVWGSLFSLINSSSRFYILDSMGTREPLLALAEVGLSLLGWATVVALLLWAARRAGGPAEGRIPALVAAWIGAFVVPALLLERTFFRAAPFLLAAGLVWIVLERRRAGEAALEARWREHLVLWAFALAALARIWLKSGPDHYGFYLLPPTLVCAAIGLTRYLESVARPPSGRALAVGTSFVLAGVTTGAFLVSLPFLTKPAKELLTARVHRLVDPDGPEATFVPYLSRLDPSTVFASVPEGAGMIFASGLTPPDDGMTTYAPMHISEASIEKGIVDAWKRRPPGVILVWGEDQRPVFGFTGFGEDYGLEIARWIADRYEVASFIPKGRTYLLLPRQELAEHGAAEAALHAVPGDDRVMPPASAGPPSLERLRLQGRPFPTGRTAPR